MRVWPIALAAMLLAAPAAAHDFWIQPERFWAPAGTPTSITLQVGHGDQRQRSQMPARRILRFTSVSPDGGVIDLTAGLTLGGERRDGEIRLPGVGTHVMALQTDAAALSRLPATRFNTYLADEGLTPAVEARRAEGRSQAEGSERYSRVSKALVRVGDGGESRATAPVGLPLEIVPLADPYGPQRREGLPVTVLYQGWPLAGALVKLTDLARDAAPVETHRTDGAGHAVFRWPERGDWLLNVIWTRPLPATDEVDFETVFSSLSYGFPPAKQEAAP